MQDKYAHRVGKIVQRLKFGRRNEVMLAQVEQLIGLAGPAYDTSEDAGRPHGLEELGRRDGQR